MKKLLVLLGACSLLAGAGCQAESGESMVPKERAEYLNLKCVSLKGDDPKLWPIYQEMLKQGKKEGYTPVIVFDELPMADYVKKENGSLEAYTSACLEKASKIEAEEVWKERDTYFKESGMDIASVRNMPAEDEEGGIGESTTALYTSYMQNAYIVEVPTDKPYEVFAYLPFGGFNDNPFDEEHIAVAKAWYEKYGAIPCAISSDIVQYYVEQPVTGRDEKLADEMYLYCPDIVWQGVQSIQNLELSNQNSSFWFFWWD